MLNNYNITLFSLQFHEVGRSSSHLKQVWKMLMTDAQLPQLKKAEHYWLKLPVFNFQH